MKYLDTKISSTQIGTVFEAEMHAIIRKWLYLCSTKD